MSFPLLSFVVMHQDGSIEPAAPAKGFRADDHFRIHARAPKSGYYYVLSETFASPGTSRGLSILYPAPGVSHYAPAGQEVHIPPESWYVFDGPSTQRMWLVWTAETVSELEYLRPRLNPRDGGVIESRKSREGTFALLEGWQKSAILNVELSSPLCCKRVE